MPLNQCKADSFPPFVDRVKALHQKGTQLRQDINERKVCMIAWIVRACRLLACMHAYTQVNHILLAHFLQTASILLMMAVPDMSIPDLPVPIEVCLTHPRLEYCF